MLVSGFALTVLNAKEEETHLFAVGQAGYILKSSSGQLLGVDLYLSECGERIEKDIGFKRLLPAIFKPSELIFDYIIATHAHFDHFDMDAIPDLMSNEKTQLYASVGCGQEIEKLDITSERIVYVQQGDTIEAGDYVLEFVSCDHGVAAPDAVGVVVEVDGKKIYITGDTCLRLDRKEEYIEKGPFDVMIGPINGAYGNLNEQNYVDLSEALNPELTIPCHYGMFAAHGGNPGVFIKKMNEQCPNNKYYLMALGEGIII